MELIVGDTPAVALGERPRAVVLLAPRGTCFHPSLALSPRGFDRLKEVVGDDLGDVGVKGGRSLGAQRVEEGSNAVLTRRAFGYLFSVNPIDRLVTQ